MIFASSSKVQQQQEQQKQQLAVLQQIPALRILPSPKQAADGLNDTSYSNLHRVSMQQQNLALEGMNDHPLAIITLITSLFLHLN